MTLSGKMRLFELASSAFFHLFLVIFLLCYFELFPVTGAGINLFLCLRIRESGGLPNCVSDFAWNIKPVRKIRINLILLWLLRLFLYQPQLHVLL